MTVRVVGWPYHGIWTYFLVELQSETEAIKIELENTPENRQKYAVGNVLQVEL